MQEYRSIFTEYTDITNLHRMGFTPVDQVQFDIYELVLVRAEDMMATMMQANDLPLYQLGFSREESDFTSITDQMVKTYPKPDRVGIKREMANIKQIIQKWQRQYGEIALSSYNKDKAKSYVNILTRMGFRLNKVSVNIGPISEVFVIN